VVDGMVLDLEQRITGKQAYDVRIGHAQSPVTKNVTGVPVPCSSRTIAGSYRLRTCSDFRRAAMARVMSASKVSATSGRSLGPCSMTRGRAVKTLRPRRRPRGPGQRSPRPTFALTFLS
jgi:hypothetical protein